MAENQKPSLEELEAEFQKRLAEKDAELAAQAEQLQALQKQSATINLQPAGTFVLEGEDPENPKKKLSTEYQFAPGHLGCRLESGIIVSSEALLKLAKGETLTEEEAAKNPALVELGAEKAKAWLTHLIVKKAATFLVKVAAALLFVLFAFSSGLNAQIKSGYVQNFPGESMTNADTIYFTVSKSITDNEQIEGIWQFAYTSTSGTPNVIIQIQERSITDNANAWSIVKTDTIKAAKKTVFFKHDVYGIEQRVFVRTTSGQVTTPVAQVRYRRKYQYP